MHGILGTVILWWLRVTLETVIGEYTYTVVQSQKVVSAYFTSEQILLIGFAEYSTALDASASNNEIMASPFGLLLRIAEGGRGPGLKMEQENCTPSQ